MAASSSEQATQPSASGPENGEEVSTEASSGDVSGGSGSGSGSGGSETGSEDATSTSTEDDESSAQELLCTDGQYCTNSARTDTEYNYHRSIPVKDFGLDIAGELQTKLDELRLDSDVLIHKLKSSQATCKDLHNENERLRRELGLNTEVKHRSHDAFLQQTVDLAKLRADYRENKTYLEQTLFELNDTKIKLAETERQLEDKKQEANKYENLFQELFSKVMSNTGSYDLPDEEVDGILDQLNNDKMRKNASVASMSKSFNQQSRKSLQPCANSSQTQTRKKSTPKPKQCKRPSNVCQTQSLHQQKPRGSRSFYPEDSRISQTMRPYRCESPPRRSLVLTNVSPYRTPVTSSQSVCRRWSPSHRRSSQAVNSRHSHIHHQHRGTNRRHSHRPRGIGQRRQRSSTVIRQKRGSVNSTSNIQKLSQTREYVNNLNRNSHNRCIAEESVSSISLSSDVQPAEIFEENQNNNASTTPQRNVNTNAKAGDLALEVNRLQNLLRQKEVQHRDFMDAFTDALIAKEAALSLADERLETSSMLEQEMYKQKDECERLIELKNDELRMKEDVIAAYRKERYALTTAFEKATKCMLAKLSNKNAVIRKMNMAHHDEISRLRTLVLSMETETANLNDVMQRMKLFHEREVAVFNQKIRELHDKLKQKDAELSNYQQITSDIVNMAEKMNLDLHVKDELIKQLREDLANFQVGIQDVEGDRVLVKQSSRDKRVVSLGFPRIVDGCVVIWYKSRSHGDNFLLLRIFGGKLFVVEKRDIIAELNRILPNLLSNPTLTHAALKIDKGTQFPYDPNACNPPSAMQMQIHVVGNQAHLAVDGRHLCSHNPVMFVDDSQDDNSLNKEITPRPYNTDIGQVIILKDADDNGKDQGVTSTDKSYTDTERRTTTDYTSDTSTTQSRTKSGKRRPTPYHPKQSITPSSTPRSSRASVWSSLSQKLRNIFSFKRKTKQTDPQKTKDRNKDRRDTTTSDAESSKSTRRYTQETVSTKRGTTSKEASSDAESAASGSSSSSSSGSSSSGKGKNRSKNARENKSQNAHTSYARKEKTTLLETNEKYDGKDMKRVTQSILAKIKEERKRYDEDPSGYQSSAELKEFHLSDPRSPLAYTMQWLDGQSDITSYKHFKRNPQARLHTIQNDIDRIGRSSHFSKKQDELKKCDLPEGAENSHISRPPKDEYDWSLPDLDLPDEFFQSIKRSEATAKSHHADLGRESAKCTIRKKQPHALVIETGLELNAWKARQIGEDYKFSRLSNNKELESFIKEHNMKTDLAFKPIPEIIFNKLTGKFELQSTDKTPRKQEAESPRSNN